MARTKESVAQGSGRVYVAMNDLPSADDVLGIFNVEGKTYQFVGPMQCGDTDYVMLRERLKQGRFAAAWVTPKVDLVYYVQRISTPNPTKGNVKAALSQTPRVTAFVTAPEPEPEPAPAPAPAPTSAAQPAKRGRGRPKGSGKKQGAATTSAPKKRGRPRKIA